MTSIDLRPYLVGAANLYGAAPYTFLTGLFAKYGVDFSPEKSLESDPQACGYRVGKNNLLSVWFDKTASDVLLKTRLNVPFYEPPTMEDLLAFREFPFRHPSEEYDRLAAYMRTSMSMPQSTVDILSDEMYSIFIKRTPLQSFFDIMNLGHIGLTSRQMHDDFLKMFFDVQRVTRAWIANGHTPRELKAMKAAAASQNQSFA